MGAQIKSIYVKDGYPFLQAGPCFHAIHEYANIMLQLVKGVNEHTSEQLKSRSPDYLWELDSMFPILSQDFEINDREFQKILKLP